MWICFPTWQRGFAYLFKLRTVRWGDYFGLYRLGHYRGRWEDWRLKEGETKCDDGSKGQRRERDYTAGIEDEGRGQEVRNVGGL